MADLQTILDKPISWRKWRTDSGLLSLLSDLQANILKGHGRDHTANIFINFDEMNPIEVGRLLSNLSFSVTPALKQLIAADNFKATGVSGGKVICLFLAAGAYAKLGGAELPSDQAFQSGMIDRGKAPTLTFPLLGDAPGLNDPPRAKWESGGPWSPGLPPPDAMLLIADDDPETLDNAKSEFSSLIRASGARILGIDIGLAQRRMQKGGSPKGEGIEHFGYVDGRSQPLFLQEDLDEALKDLRKETGKPAAEPAWSERFEPRQFIVADPLGSGDFSCGSYFVYRKLEQDVEAFKRRERQLAGWLGLTGDDAERAGALVVGRFENGTPVVLSGEEEDKAPTNDFNYDQATVIDDVGKAIKDKLGNELQKCPFRGHVRKTNPRTKDNVFERGRLMARRGITYGTRENRPVGSDFAESDRPSGGVGLIFMAYMADINGQFEFTQAAWAGSNDFQVAGAGIDPVIGQQANRAGTSDVHWVDGFSVEHNHPTAEGDYDFKTAVTLMGGEYFFAPSISFLQSAGRFVTPTLIV